MHAALRCAADLVRYITATASDLQLFVAPDQESYSKSD